jgi:hypothetical protein
MHRMPNTRLKPDQTLHHQQNEPSKQKDRTNRRKHVSDQSSRPKHYSPTNSELVQRLKMAVITTTTIALPPSNGRPHA